MKNIVIVFTALLISTATCASDKTSQYSSLFVLNNSEHYMKIEIALSDKNICDGLILPPDASVEIEDAEQKSLHLLGRLLNVDTLKRAEEGGFGYVDDVDAQFLSGIILTSKKLSDLPLGLSEPVPLLESTPLFIVRSQISLEKALKYIQENKDISTEKTAE